jgi:excisionase family DNA binding protein
MNRLDSTFLNSAQVAQWLGVAQRTVCLWAELQEIPAFKLGHQWRFRQDELQRWLESASGRSKCNIASGVDTTLRRRIALAN